MTLDVNYLSFDIETAANDRIDEYLERTEFKAPSNYTDPSKIEAYKDKERSKAKREAGKYWWTGRIVCLSYLDHLTRDSKSIFHFNEKDIIEEFFCLLSDLYKDRQLVGAYSKDFDIPYLIGRSMALNIGLPKQLRPFKPISDVNEIFSYSRACTQLSKVADYAFGIGLSKTDDMDGSKVQPLWDQIVFSKGEEQTRYINLLKEYCLQDSVIVDQLIYRATKPFERLLTPIEAKDIPF